MVKLNISKGDKHYHFTVIHEVKKEGDTTNRYVLCKCECGEERIVKVHSLLNGLHKSCGCESKTVFKKEYKYTKEEYAKRKKNLETLRKIQNHLPH